MNVKFARGLKSVNRVLCGESIRNAGEDIRNNPSGEPLDMLHPFGGVTAVRLAAMSDESIDPSGIFPA